MRYRYDRDLGAVLPADGANFYEPNPKRADLACPMVIPDVAEYRTVAGDVARDGKRTVISSRSQHRDFLRRNGYVEVGNERLKSRKPVALSREKRIEDIKRAAYYVSQGRQHELGNDRPFGGSD